MLDVQDIRDVRLEHDWGVPGRDVKKMQCSCMCLLHKPSLKSNRCQTAIESLCWLCVCVRKERLDRSAGVCAYEINLIAMWLVHTDDSVPYICSVASSLLCKHIVLAAPENGEQFF